VQQIMRRAVPLSGRPRGFLADALYRILDSPYVYNVAQNVLAPGVHHRFTRAFRETAARLPAARRILDVGCGPSSWLWRVGLQPVGLDITWSYAARFGATGSRVVTASSAAIPFATGSFDQAWCIGLLHHLSDDDARRTLAEMRRVTDGGGSVVIADAVLPRSAWRRPVAYVLRKLDRGGRVRTEAQHRALLGDGWSVTRILMAYNGLEATIAVHPALAAAGSSRRRTA
jgi:SAM-dependent methyltransferase